jgi:23S rRNA pseudouridine1911/1915/1917 synthase
LYEDNHLIAVNKLAGELSQGDETGDEPLGELVKAYIRKTYSKPGAVFLGVVHRLDRPVSGVILFARTSKALERMTALMRSRDIQKTYWAIVEQKPPKLADELRHFLKRESGKNLTRAYSRYRDDAKESSLTYRLLRTCGNYHLLEIIPQTGRQHQIRAQLAAIGCPIAGDVKYGASAPLPDASIALHARKIRFVHPVKKTPLQIIAPPPENELFKKCAANEV